MVLNLHSLSIVLALKKTLDILVNQLRPSSPKHLHMPMSIQSGPSAFLNFIVLIAYVILSLLMLSQTTNGPISLLGRTSSSLLKNL